ncbi:clan AA aspartic protease [Roseateles sp. DAIF2]|uniref:retropepsin-like aspartic protease family protein n=1 Tax=Roseateles sp. DAIF2 TaxID=2714952 RepID=UPI0018A2D972|nr:retropepsin-like aspartic protease [Roseateles sp. DAIF2]QPF71928.1 clan AA aspartic protease [Roseateles sp. DAIF2]
MQQPQAPQLPHSLKLVTIWLLVTGAVFLGFKAWEHRQAQSRIELHQGRIVLQRGADGHFHWPGRINGVAVDFLVDTGASSTALPQELAERAGLKALGAVRSHTAGGVAQGWMARADVELQGGVRAQQLPVTVLPQLGAPLLGMDLLSKLRFTQGDGRLTIEAP